MLSIGEFSLVCQLSIKTLRYYHDQGILPPVKVDTETGYRYYDRTSLTRVREIQLWKDMGFSIREIRELCLESDPSRIEAKLQDKEQELIRRIGTMEGQKQRIRQKLAEQKERFSKPEYPVEERELAPFRYLSVFMKGPYHRIGQAFYKLYQEAGKALKGDSFVFYYEQEYRDEATMEACSLFEPKELPLNVSPREHRGGSIVSLIHKGPYDRMGESYIRLFDYCREKEYRILLPHRAIYLNHPGRIPADKLETEIQLWVES